MNFKTFLNKWGRRVLLFFIIKSETFKQAYYAMQRAWYGYSNQDVFAIDYWLCEVIPPAIDELISKKQGCPGEFLKNKVDPTDEDLYAGIEEWKMVMREIRDGFAAWGDLQKNQYRLSPEQKEERKKKFYKGLELMGRYFHTMWW